ncbi:MULTISPECIES: hypothetical protein [Acidianus]|uniref:Signal recognition particle n=1 Tax=Candidatus Acidianus copahuensis TaxID=1160895 RepID=A0A031LMN9_9CREN|nr:MULTISPECIES: hypothetical protein [Acidianus]EZQ04746.1 signal recognition particle [Candidatus Acidianus copahuensis]NON61583.1 hypothetical protein [Acidianus sp. RZ1]
MSLRDFENKKVAIWLAYFTASSRRNGRRFKKIKIDLNDIVSIAKQLDLEPEVMEKVHPGSRIKGLVLVKKVASKEKVLKMVYSYASQKK